MLILYLYIYNSGDAMSGKLKTIATTFNMSVKLKEKAQIYIASSNRAFKEKGIGEKTNLGILINKLLEKFLEGQDTNE
jgi:hypothetical protein